MPEEPLIDRVPEARNPSIDGMGRWRFGWLWCFTFVVICVVLGAVFVNILRHFYPDGSHFGYVASIIYDAFLLIVGILVLGMGRAIGSRIGRPITAIILGALAGL